MKEIPGKKLALAATAASVMFIGGPVAGTQDGSAAADSINVTGSAFYSPRHIMARSIVAYGEAVTEATDGRVEFEWYYGDSLVTPGEMPRSLNAGIVDLAYLVPAYNPADFPADQWASLLGYGNDDRPVVGLLAAAAASIELGLSVPALADEIETSGSVPLIPRFQNWDNYQLLCNDPVTTLEDASGKRVRVGGDAFERLARSLGMSPVTVSGGEIFESLDRGVVDCFMGGEGDMVGLGLWEIANNYTPIMAAGWNSFSLAAGESFFNELDEDVQDAFRDNLAVLIEQYYTNYLIDQYEFFRTAGERHGMAFHEPSEDLVQAVEEHYDGIRDYLIANAPDVIPNPEEVIDEYDRLLADWADLIVELGYDPGTYSRVEWASRGPDEIDIDLGPWAAEVQSRIFDEYVD